MNSMNLLVLDFAVKGAALLAATAVAAFLLRRRSASVVHRVWLLGMASLLAVPMATALLPQWSVKVIPSRSSTQLTSELPITSGVGTELTQRQTPSRYSTSPLSRDLPRDERTASTRLADSPSRAERSAAVTEWTNVLQPSLLLVAVWASGTSALLLRLLIHQSMLIRLLRRCTPMRDEAWIHAVEEASRKLGLRRRVRLVRAATATTPATAGTWWPTVILPARIDDWTASQRQVVLLHELAHVKRYDVLAHNVAAIACAVHWFNPLVWLGIRQMRTLREVACDDLVLAGGHRATDYAESLLNVARNYRATRLAGTIGMTRGANVEHRILAILDAARNRVPLTRRASIALAILAATTIATLGAVRLESRADEVTDSSAKENSSAPTSKSQPAADIDAKTALPDGGETTLEVLITDDDNRPLPGAKVLASYWKVEGGKDYPTRTFTTDASGLARVPRPRRLNILRLWPAQAGYVPEFFNFAEGTHDDGEKIPDRLHFRLARGTKLSGRIVDEAGKPIAGAKVEVSVEVRETAWGLGADAMISTWLTVEDFNSPPPITDADGRWSIDNAPAQAGEKDFEFRLKITYDQYASDREWGQHQHAQGITTEMLRAGTATIALKSGVTVEGTIVDSTQTPVTKGLVIWSDRPYWAEGVNETQIDTEGRFRTIPLKPGEYPITVAAPGFQPIQQMVQVEGGMKPLRLELSAGKKLVLNIVDREGRSIPNVDVGLDGWRGTEALYNEKHPNVPESGIPRMSDKDGVYVWDWAPDDAVTYRLGSKGYASQAVTLVAKSTPHVVTLPDARVVVGTATDAVSGKPIARFFAMPVIVFRPNFFHSRTEDAKVGQDGRYELPLTGSDDPNNRYRVRFEADGYRSLVSAESLGPNDGRVTLDVKLEPAAARTGRIVDANGRPIENVMMLEASPTDVPHVSNNEPRNFSSRPMKSDSRGNFSFRATSEPVLLRALHEHGFAEVRREPNEEFGTLRLLAWARIEGRLVQDGQPIRDQSISFTPAIHRQLGEPRFQASYQATTDSEGRFVFDRLPPVVGSLRAYLGPWQDSPLTSSESVPLDLQPDEQRSLVLGGSPGTKLTGKVVPMGRGNIPLDTHYSLNYLVSRERGVSLPAGFPKLGFQPNDGAPLEVAWLDDPHYDAWQSTRANFFVKLSPTGALAVSRIPPGMYDLVIQLYEQPAGCLVQTIGRRIVPVEVTDADVLSGEKLLDDIEVPCRVGPRVGENMQAYKFVDTEGREQSVFDMQGKFVLMHVWATWCGPCMETLPDLQATLASYSDKPVVFVGLNIDADTAQAKSLVQERGWTWSHTYLGSDSEMTRQLAVSTAPAYFLIGPDGNLVASSNDWDQMRETIDTSVAGKPLNR